MMSLGLQLAGLALFGGIVLLKPFLAPSRAVLLLAGLLICGVSPASGQGAVWEHDGVRVTYPMGWTLDDASNARVFSPSANERLRGSFFVKRVGGMLRARNLSAAAYRLGSIPAGAQLADIANEMVRRMSASYEVVDSYSVTDSGPFLAAYRFHHSGDPVTQAAIFLEGPARTLYMLELTGHRRDEDALLGEARQIAHSTR